ncbi:MAG: hypothetical protein R2828_21340 [Saprospiraceae bacterium]
MESSLFNQFSWPGFLTLAVGLVLLYFILHAAKSLSQRTSALGRFQSTITHRIQQVLLIYEPLAGLMLIGAFVMVNPVFHGLLFALLLLGSFTHVKNYISGRIVQFEHSHLIDKRLKTKDYQGIIVQTGRLGLQLETSEGLHNISYTTLQANGYTLLSGEDVGGVFQLRIKKEKAGERINNPVQLLDLLATAPYVDWNHKPELLPAFESDGSIQVRIRVQEESHLYDLLELIKEWGFTPSVSN